MDLQHCTETPTAFVSDMHTYYVLSCENVYQNL